MMIDVPIRFHVLLTCTQAQYYLLCKGNFIKKSDKLLYNCHNNNNNYYYK